LQPDSDVKDEAETGEPHAVELTVWDVPSASAAGERLRFMAGARCTAGCDLGGAAVGVYDQAGTCVGTAKLGREVWPGTEALYVAEVEASAPPAACNPQWEVKAGGWENKVPHEARSFPMALCVVDPPDYVVTVKVVARESLIPIPGARVVMHPYRAVTDESGTATVRVAKGQYDLLVSGRGHAAVCSSVDVTADLATSTELEADQPWVYPDEDFA
jgi:hypothetical protein